MTEKKLRITFIHNLADNFYTGQHTDNTTYEFLIKAMQRNKRIEYTVVPVSQEYDAETRLKGKCDAVILASCRDYNIQKIHGLKKLNVPIISRCGDFHDAPRYGTGEQNYRDYGINCMFNFMSEKYFLKYYPSSMNYHTILFGVEPSLYQNLVPFKDRISNVIRNSGIVESNTALWHRTGSALLRYAKDVVKNPERLTLKSRLLHARANLYHHYKLRSICNKLDYVTYSTDNITKILEPYSYMLSKYRSAIAATSYYPTIKYWEIAAAGCLTFMEITDRNDGQYLGFRDKENCISINEDNYNERFDEYLEDTENPIWAKIAKAGQLHALNNFNNDKAVDDLVDLIMKFL